MQIQVILSLVVILGAACVALLVDYFRNKNNQVREAMVEMKVRQIEKERQLLAPSQTFTGAIPVTVQSQVSAIPAEYVHSPAAKVEVPARLKEEPLVRNKEGSPPVDTGGPGEGFTARRRRRSAVEVVITDPDGKDDDMNSKKAFSDWLIQRAAARAAQKLDADVPKAPKQNVAPVDPAPPAEAEAPAAFAEPPLADTLVQPMVTPAAPLDIAQTEPEQVEINPPSVAGFTPRFEPVVVDEFLWRSLFEDKADPEPSPIVIASPAPEASLPEPPEAPAVVEADAPARHDSGFHIVQAMQPATEPLTPPAGFHDLRILEQLQQSEQLFSGLIVSVGITQGEPSTPEDLTQSVTAFVRTLLRESDFACRTAEDEYLLICPNLSGVAAHRHLSALSERLWDFQLRALGSFLMLFSLGGVDVQREPLTEAIASANERMSQTKRSRKAIIMLTPGQRRRKAV